MKAASKGMSKATYRVRGFSLVEVVLALGVVGFALVAILGVFPVGLTTQHSAQDDTRAAQAEHLQRGEQHDERPHQRLRSNRESQHRNHPRDEALRGRWTAGYQLEQGQQAAHRH